MTGAFWISLVLVFLIGVAVQRGNTCTVVAIDDIVHRRSVNRFLGIAYCWLLVAGGLTLLNLATGFVPVAKLFPVTVWSVAGGLLLGIGAVVNGACTTGTVARIGSGEYAFATAIVGFFLGCLLSPHLFPEAAITHVGTSPVTTSLNHPVLAVAGLVFVIAVTVRRWITGPHESVADFLRNAWDPRTAILVIAMLFVALVQIFGAWSYTDLLGDLSAGRTTEAVQRLVLLAALLGGAVLAGRTQRGARQIGPLAPRLLRCGIGGLIMGIGFSISPGAFDGLTLFGQPLLLPYAWVVMGSSYAAIVAGVLWLRSRMGARVKTRRG